ncbi:hypothetical protein B0H15DRAFT_854933 [Mycena belliarum]|uniref:Uncharacterized protein n=1 Tax=Mycena belliarum TaxID=1033014 RepID=A0AAD6TX76_9AGAR|nr:hypothetical protein B0H15DRAFT_854933 [Mycena belliae]
MHGRGRPPSTPRRGRGSSSSAARRSARTRREDGPASSGGGERSQNPSQRRTHRPARLSPPPPQTTTLCELNSEAESIDFPEALLGQIKTRPWVSPLKRERQLRERKERERLEKQRRQRRRPPAPGQEIYDEDGVLCTPSTSTSKPRRPRTMSSSVIIEIPSTDDEERTPTRRRPQKLKRPPSKPVDPGSVIDLATTTAEEDNGPVALSFTTNEVHSSPTCRPPLKRKHRDEEQLVSRKRPRADSVAELEMRNADEDGPGTPPPPTEAEDYIGADGLDFDMEPMVEAPTLGDIGQDVPDGIEEEVIRAGPEEETPREQDSVAPAITHDTNLPTLPPETSADHLADQLLNEQIFDAALALVAEELSTTRSFPESDALKSPTRSTAPVGATPVENGPSLRGTVVPSSPSLRDRSPTRLTTPAGPVPVQNIPPLHRPGVPSSPLLARVSTAPTPLLLQPTRPYASNPSPTASRTPPTPSTGVSHEQGFYYSTLQAMRSRGSLSGARAPPKPAMRQPPGMHATGVRNAVDLATRAGDVTGVIKADDAEPMPAQLQRDVSSDERASRTQPVAPPSPQHCPAERTPPAEPDFPAADSVATTAAVDYTPPLSPISDSTLGATPPYAASGLVILVDASVAVKEVDELSDGISEFGDLGYPSDYT